MQTYIRSILAALVLGLAVPASLPAADDIQVTAVPVMKQIYMLTGKGGNIGLFIGEDGTFLIDDQYAPLTDKIIAAIESVGGTLPKFLINTHYHGDHTGGNENIGGKGTIIFSHDNVRERLLTGSYLKPFDMKQAKSTKEGLPVVTFSEDISFHLNGDTVHALHVAHAHTDGDSFIHFLNENVIHTGDIFFNGFYPFIDVEHGGSLKGMINGVDAILSLADEKTRIIPGHGPLGSKADLKHYRDMLAEAYKRLNNLKIAGKSAEEAVAEKPLEDLEKEWGDGLFTGDKWIAIIYQGV
jgi:cyclase